MKKGQKISQSDLESQGWTVRCSFAHYTVYGKEEQRIMWNPQTTEIELVYNSEF